MKRQVQIISTLIFFLLIGNYSFSQESNENFRTVSNSGFAPSKGVNIHYRIFGSDQPLLVINGGPGFSSKGFTKLAKQLAQRYQVILYDQRGTGKSKMTDIDSTNMTMDFMVEDMEALRKHLNLSKWTILGHSFGGIMANYYTSKHPDCVSGIIASSSGGVDLELLDYFDISQQLSPTESDSLNYWISKINNGDTSTYADKKRREFFASAYVYNDKHIPEIAERMTQSNPTINGLIWNDLRRIGYDVSEELSTFEKPVLIMQGKQDILQERTAKKNHNVFPNSNLVLLDACGHYGWLDQPEQYFKEIDAFMESIE
ncbi:alpha/beta hydrolase [Galbibacter sp. EGI 63066]|uniref:alpha/beta fold hydrolase n=1 Tax=Galbibacter sp. EGI 63066 TaxID=2993559 RepID=UPI0022497EFE|nr:alpha/beta hydrolase [Galbibacter sp. EGI 63066]MCX2679803.1 alpha/beta hydrolase [Galbibacter sp. EGI 63066]